MLRLFFLKLQFIALRIINGKSFNHTARILFVGTHFESMIFEEPEFLSLFRQLARNYRIGCCSTPLSSKKINKYNILVIGAPLDIFRLKEIEAITQFVEKGGGLLVVTNREAMSRLSPAPKPLTEIGGIQATQNFNELPNNLKIFQPHYITANVEKIMIGRDKGGNTGVDTAQFVISDADSAKPLAFTDKPRQVVIACATREQGRIVTAGSTELFSNSLLNKKSNKQFISNVFSWLAAANPIEIETFIVPETLEWEQRGTVELTLKNTAGKILSEVRCILQSDAGAEIPEPEQVIHSMPPGNLSTRKWSIQPKCLGYQKLRLILTVNKHIQLFFHGSPDIRCLAKGHLSLEILEQPCESTEQAGKLKTTFHTEECFIAKGNFHWSSVREMPSYSLDLSFGKELVEREPAPCVDKRCWRFQAVKPGTCELILKLKETNQLLPVQVVIKPSDVERIREIENAYVSPLDAEIAARLNAVDESLAPQRLKAQQFKILSPEDYLRAVYNEETCLWLEGSVAAARREEYVNQELLDIFLQYFVPTYISNKGAFVPCDPNLASQLAKIHPENRKLIESALLFSKETEEIEIKQSIAACLLHEKYGHGFFFTQTRLGKQLALLEQHEFPDENNEKHFVYRKVVRRLRDSAIIVNEGFAAWLELNFLPKLDRETRLGTYFRQSVLLRESQIFKKEQKRSEFFKKFPSRYGSRYKEGHEDLDFISSDFNTRCAIRIFNLATDIDFGITENQGELDFKFDVRIIKDMLNKEKGCSHLRLHKMADILFKRRNEVKQLARARHCRNDCNKMVCPLETFIKNHLKWKT